MFWRKSSNSRKQNDSDIPPHPGPDADGVERVIPKEIWDGPQGDFLREIGASPDDPSNLRLTQDAVEARFAQLRKDQDAFVASVNKDLPPSATVIPWAMIPWSVWNQQHAEFLLRVCELYPVGPWNMMLLPEDEAGALVLDLPQHLQGVPPGLEDAANHVIGKIRERFSEAHRRTGAALAEGDLSSLDEHGNARDQAVASMCALAQALGSETYGEEAFARHKALFGRTLGWVTDTGGPG